MVNKKSFCKNHGLQKGIQNLNEKKNKLFKKYIKCDNKNKIKDFTSRI